MRTKHLVEALESTMGWKDGHPLPGRLDIYDSIKHLSIDTDTGVSIEVIRKDLRSWLM